MNKHDLELTLVNARETLPRLWWSYYQGSLQAGFTEDQAFAIVTATILATNTMGIRPDNPQNREGKDT